MSLPPPAQNPVVPAPPAAYVSTVPVEPTLFQRYWPGPQGPAGPAVFVAVPLAGLVGAVTLVLGRPGLGWALCGLALAGVGVAVRVAGAGSTPRPPRERLVSAGWAAGCLALLTVPVLRADGWLAAYCLVAAVCCGSLALTGGRTAAGLAAGTTAALLAPVRAAPWLLRGVQRLSGRTGGTRLGRTLLLTAALLVLFGALLASADAAFDELLTALVPTVNGGRIATGLLVLVAAAGVALLTASRPTFDDIPAGRRASARRTEWAVPLAALNGLFLVFVLVQAAILFGGRDLVLRPGGPTYAEYARSGFWQLLAVTLLTLAVLGGALRWAPRTERVDRLLLRVLLGGLSALTLVIVASALTRLSLYEHAYGYTRLRLLVGVVELWLALLFVLVLVALVRLRTRWLPRVVLASAVLVLLGVGAAGPDRFVAEQNVRRYHDTGRIDVAYLSRLSAEAVPALLCLPADLRERAVGPIADRLAAEPDAGDTWNLGRSRARALLAQAPDCG